MRGKAIKVRVKVVKIFVIIFFVGLSFLFSSCTDINDKYKNIRGAWNCFSEPETVRVFYKNGQYLEFGRATPYARKSLWTYDYISTGFYNIQDSILTIREKPIMLLNGKQEKIKTRLITVTNTSRFRIIELKKKSKFLRKLKQAHSARSITSTEALLCKKRSTIGFSSFVSYLAETRLVNQANKSLQLKRTRALKHIIRKKRLLSNQLNRLLSRQHHVGLLWLLKELEIEKYTRKIDYRVRRVMRNGDYFKIEIILSEQSFQEKILSPLKSSNSVKIVRTKIYRTHKGVVLKVTLKRRPDLRAYLSLVSLPNSIAWLAHHKLQLKQLQLYQKLFSRRIGSTYKDISTPDTVHNIESITRQFPGIKWSKSIVRNNRAAITYRLSYVASYYKVKKLLHSLSNNKFQKIISSASIESLIKKPKSASYNSGRDKSSNKVKLNARIQLQSKNLFNSAMFNRLLVKTHLLSIVPIKTQTISSYKSNLFN